MTQKVGVVGCGYWGKNLVRVFSELGVLHAVCDDQADLAEAFASRYDCAAMTWQSLITDPEIDAIAIAAPAALHRQLAVEALEAGKHIFVEKPLALTVDDAEAILKTAERVDRVCMVGHLLRYHPVFTALYGLVSDGDLGKLRYVYSNRVNLGKVRREEDILWSFAPHDISMILALVGEEPTEVEATGHSYLRADIADITMTSMKFASGVAGHVFVSWLHPFKEQRLVVVGDRAMAVFDDSEPWERKLALYNHAIEWRQGNAIPSKADANYLQVPESEPLRNECEHFLGSVAGAHPPLTDGSEAIRVLRVLSKATASMSAAGESPRREATPAPRPKGVHETAVIDDDVSIGEGTKIWHFSHVLSDSTIGTDCSLGQNVVVGPGVTIGDRCKIQNNVSVYEGVTLEDDVFCGPSCVFTNVNNPRAAVNRRSEFLPTIVRRGASIGANATIVCGSTLGAYCFVAAGATVTADVPDFALVVGTPARRIGWMSRSGHRLGADLVCPETGEVYEETGPEQLALREDRA